MAYIVKAFTPGKLNLAPETLEEEIGRASCRERV